jgi:predicted  nucleic acid-binding Zn-ribbon protein
MTTPRYRIGRAGYKRGLRGFLCLHCGHKLMLNMSQRSSRFSQVCPQCGWNQWEVCPRSALRHELAAADEVKSVHNTQGSIMTLSAARHERKDEP